MPDSSTSLQAQPSECEQSLQLCREAREGAEASIPSFARKEGDDKKEHYSGSQSRGTLQAKSADRELGRGRSGIVFGSLDESGRCIARKIFGSSGVTKIVQYALLGAPNPYVWSEPAIRSAVLRRRILSQLVEFWFGAKLRVSRAYGHAWNVEHRAYEMRCELINGRHAALHHCYTSPDDTELQDATRQIMKPLQAHLVESGFDGLVWQAGLSNPVALNNFMCEGPDGNGGYRWAWIDLESGVPALIPINPLVLVRFYLPKSLRHGGPLFDDVDVDTLRAYVARQRNGLEVRLGRERLGELDDDIDALARNQVEWKSLPRHRCSVAYHRAKGSISHNQAEWYAQRPLRWYGRESLRAIRSVPRLVVACVSSVAGVIAKVKVGRVLIACWQGLCSQAYRERLAREYVATRIARWSARGQLSDQHADALCGQLDQDESSSYLTDFGVHLAVKPLVKLAQFWLMPTLWMAGVIDEAFLWAFFIAGGSVVRTLYTLGRLLQNTLTRRERPWVALGAGTLPVVGNMAFPLQIIFSGAHDQRSVARFILYDTFSRLGQWFPIWGGADSLTEHVANRLANILIRPNTSVTADTAGDGDALRGDDAPQTIIPEPLPV